MQFLEIDKTSLTDQTKYRLNEITKIENYFNSEIIQRKLCSKKLSKYVAASDYVGKILIVLSATSCGVSIISFTSILGAPVGIGSASFTLIFSLKARRHCEMFLSGYFMKHVFHDSFTV